MAAPDAGAEAACCRSGGASPEEEPVVGASKLHGEAPPEGVLDACDFFLKKESCALPKGSKHWGPVTWMDPKVGKPGIGFYKIETIACPAC